MKGGPFWRQLRILALLLVLLFVALTTAQNRWRTTDWDEPLWVAVHPIDGDQSSASRHTIAALGPSSFAAVEQFVAREAHRHGVAVARPVELHVAAPVSELPPAPPAKRTWWRIAWWSLELRYWSWLVTRRSEPSADIELFVIYYDPATHPVLPHSYALDKALLGVARVFASTDARARNRVVIAHELFHTFGATDKYDPGTDLPRFPAGFAEPQRAPLFPQRRAELMAGRIPLAPDRAEMPASLDQVMIGPATAAEIGWK